MQGSEISSLLMTAGILSCVAYVAIKVKYLDKMVVSYKEAEISSLKTENKHLRSLSVPSFSAYVENASKVVEKLAKSGLKAEQEVT